MNAHSKIGEALDSLETAETPEIKELKPRSKRARALAEGRDIRASFVIKNPVYRQALELCEKHSAPLQQVLEDALDLYLKTRGMPGYGEGK